MKVLDLFSGIGGFALACEWAGMDTISPSDTRASGRFTDFAWTRGIKSARDLFQRRAPQIPQPLICRDDDGFPHRVERLEAIGNAVVPLVAYQFMKAIKEVNDLL